MIWQPEREIEIIAGTPPGGGLDRSARALVKAITATGLLDVPVRVVNVGGEGGRKAWRHVEQHARDGHVIGISSPNMTADYLIGVTKSDPGGLHRWRSCTANTSRLLFAPTRPSAAAPT
jgi:putative tricarboxylic transport membrane protein